MSASDTNHILYIDGVQAGSNTDNVPFVASAGLTGRIGTLFAQVEETYFNGSIDEVRIYERALSAAEIATIHANGFETYVYDGDGVRVKKTVGGTTTVYVNKYYQVTGSTATKHYYFGGQLVAVKEGAALRYLHTDHLGSSSVPTDTSGASAGSQTYKPFGETRASSGTFGTDRKFTGQRLDGTGLYFYNARYYDAALGRFISPDPLIPHRYNPQAYNRYSYVFNNPLRYTDPTGYCPFCDFVSNTFQAVASDPLAVAHVGLDHLGYVPGPLGMAADALNAGLYLAEGDFANAALSGVAIVPVAGDAVKASKSLKLADDAAAKMKEVHKRGKAGETQYGVDDPKKKIVSLSGMATKRYPDKVTDTAIHEVKNAKKVRLDSQLKDYILYAKQKDIDFILVVRRNSKVDSSIEKYAKKNDVNIRILYELE